MDFGFYKAIPEKHLEHLRKLKLPELKTEHLAFQIVDHSLGIEEGSLDVAAGDSQIVSESLKSFLKQHVQNGIPKAVRRRVDQVNDPGEFFDSLNPTNLSLGNLQESLQELVSKFEFKLPDKLMLPAGAFFAANTLASKI